MRHIIYIWVLVWLGAGFRVSAVPVAATTSATNASTQTPAKARIHAISDPRATSAFIPDPEVVRSWWTGAVGAVWEDQYSHRLEGVG